mmetsp:Transcript_19643/g.27404  ORF Transcript_19643/g.27404 Transcript_19643/m.27404 type:complete len:87 (-) Transcript_19643:58-318(-)
MFAVRRQQLGQSSSTRFVFTSIFKRSDYSSLKSTPQGPSTTIVQTSTSTTSASSYNQPQYALPPMNPEFMAAQQVANPYPYYGSTA